MIKTYTVPEKPFDPKLSLALLSALFWSFIVSFLYGVIMAFSPLIYFNFFITVLFGTVLGYGVRILSKLFKILNKKTIIGLSLGCGLFGIYFSWVVYILYFISTESFVTDYFIHPLLVFRPLEVLRIVTEMNTYGLWEFFGVTFKGWILTLIWLFEAAIILIVPALVIWKQPIAPFSIKYGKWYKKYVLTKDFRSIAMKKDFLSRLETDGISIIDTLEKGRATHFARVSVYFLPEENEQYLSIENVSRDRQGKKEKTSEVIHLMNIKTSEAKNLIAKYHGEKVFVLDY